MPQGDTSELWRLETCWLAVRNICETPFFQITWPEPKLPWSYPSYSPSSSSCGQRTISVTKALKYFQGMLYTFFLPYAWSSCWEWKGHLVTHNLDAKRMTLPGDMKPISICFFFSFSAVIKRKRKKHFYILSSAIYRRRRPFQKLSRWKKKRRNSVVVGTKWGTCVDFSQHYKHLPGRAGRLICDLPTPLLPRTQKEKNKHPKKRAPVPRKRALPTISGHGWL